MMWAAFLRSDVLLILNGLPFGHSSLVWQTLYFVVKLKFLVSW